MKKIQKSKFIYIQGIIIKELKSVFFAEPPE